MKKRWALCFGCVVLAASAAQGAQDEKARVLEPIVVTASRYEESVLDTAKSVTVIGEDGIRESGARTVPELLDKQAGIAVRDILGNGKAAQVDIRGFGETAPSNVLVLVDGRRSNQIDISGADWSQINIDSIERIEIVRGPSSVLYGDNAVSGVVNIITKKGTGRKPGAGFKYKMGSYAYQSYKGYVSGGTPFLDYYLDYVSSMTNGYRFNSDLETSDWSGSFLVKPSDMLNIKVQYGYHRDWYGQPGTITRAQLDANGPRTAGTPTDRSKTEDTYVVVGPEVKASGAFGDIVLSADMEYRSRRTASVFNSTIGANEFNNFIRTMGISPKAVLTGEVLGMKNRLIVGGDYYNYRDEILSSAYDALTNSYPNKDFIVIREQTGGIYISDTLSLTDELSVNGGYRAEWADYWFDQREQAHMKAKRRPFEFGAEGRVNYKYNERSSVYASYGHSFRFPAVDEWYTSIWTFFGVPMGGGLNMDLAPQTGDHYEVGVIENTLKWLKLMVSGYLYDLRHEIFVDPTATLANVNNVYDHTRRYGLELEGRLNPLEGLELFGTYTYTKAFFVGERYASNEIPLVPEDKITGGVEYTYKGCATVRYEVQYTGTRRFTSDLYNLAPKLKRYVVQNVRLGYRKFGLELYYEIYNIFDEKYSESGVTNMTGRRQNYYPAPGRTMMFGVDYSF